MAATIDSFRVERLVILDGVSHRLPRFDKSFSKVLVICCPVLRCGKIRLNRMVQRKNTRTNCIGMLHQVLIYEKVEWGFGFRLLLSRNFVAKHSMNFPALEAYIFVLYHYSFWFFGHRALYIVVKAAGEHPCCDGCYKVDDVDRPFATSGGKLNV